MKSEYSDQIKRCVKEWFPEHTATFQEEKGLYDPSLLYWAKPNTSCYKCVYIIHGNALMIYGDIGCAVYRWSQHIDWGFLSDCNLQYFAEKCEASEKGRDFNQWNAARLAKRVEEMLAERDPDLLNQKLTRRVLREICLCSCPEDWKNIAQPNPHLFGQDWYELTESAYELNCRCVGHWVGIWMAMGKTEQLLKMFT